MIVLFIGMFWSCAGIVGICEFGERLCSTFEEINDMYHQFAWYRFPCKAKRMLITLLMIAQKPVELRVFGSISCGRVTLKSVSMKI